MGGLHVALYLEVNDFYYCLSLALLALGTARSGEKILPREMHIYMTAGVNRIGELNSEEAEGRAQAQI